MLADILQGPSAIQCILCFLIALIVFFKKIFPSSDKSPSYVNTPPRPCMPLPVFGHALYMRNGPIQKLKEWKEKCGDIYSINVGYKLYVVISSEKLLREALVKNAYLFSDRPPSLFHAAIVDGDAGLIDSSGAKWKEQRSESLSILRSFGMGKSWMADRVLEEVLIYLEKLAEQDGRPTDICRLTSLSISNIICSILIGQRFDLDDNEFCHYTETLNTLATLIGLTTMLSVFPWARHLPGDLFKVNQLISLQNYMDRTFTVHFIQKQMENMTVGEPKSFIDAYLKRLKRKREEGKPTHMTERNLRRVVSDLFIAGSETICTTILWFMVYMLHYPDIQEKVHKEIVEVVGTDRQPNLQDKTKLNFLNATIMETQRISSVVPLSLLHYCSQTVEIGGYTIPKESVVIPNLYCVLKDEKVWPDPETLKPERFLHPDGSLLVPEEFIPFSLGRRACIGEALARMELYLFLASLFQQFQLLPEDPKKLPDLEPIIGVTRAPKPFRLRLQKRV